LGQAQVFSQSDYASVGNGYDLILVRIPTRRNVLPESVTLDTGA